MRLRLALLALALAGVATSVVAPRVTSAQAPAVAIERFDATRRILAGAGEPEAILHRLVVHSRCPALFVEWYSTNLEPTVERTRARIELRIDGTAVAHGRAGGGAGIYEDGPVRVSWYGALPPGRHVIEAALRGEDSGSSNWGVPYVDPQRPGVDLLAAWPLGRSAGEPCQG